MALEIEKGRIGSSFDDFLRKEGAYEETTERAIKRVLARQIQSVVEAKNLTKRLGVFDKNKPPGTS